jgi:isoquinoline 1-oxidoreductase beta subunit
MPRREFLQVTAIAGGMLIAVPIPFRIRQSAQGSGRLTAYVRIDRDGVVTILAPKIEMGQGTRTSLPMLVAEELDVDWSTVRVEPAPLDEATYGWQGAGGSTSVWEGWEPLRKAGAVARQLLVHAAAQRWEVPAEQCRTERGRVWHDASRRSAPYGELVAAAATLPAVQAPALKDPSAFRIIGTPTAQPELREIVTGQAQYGLDTKVADLLRVSIERAPLGARPIAIRDTAARQVPGVRDVIPLDASAHPAILAHGVAVVADSTWAALQGRRALAVDWSASPEPSTEELQRRLRDRVNAPAKPVRSDGDFDRAIAQAQRRLEAQYELPFLAHAPMEPGNCFADVRRDRVVIRAPLQDPVEAQQIAATLTGLPASAITVEPARLGGGFGRRLSSDYAAEAVALGLKVGAPIQIVWTREDDIRFDLYRPIAVHRLWAGLDAAGRITAWKHRQVSTSRYGYQAPQRPPESSEFYRDDPPAYLVPNYRLEYAPMDSLVPRGAWRSVVHSGNAFVVQSFLDELAHAAGQDPIEFRLRLLGEDRDLPYADHGGPVLNTGRLRRVLEVVADKAGWGTAAPAPRAWGVAAHFTFGSYAAQAALVSVDSGTVHVHRVVAAIDCGFPVNPAGIRQQVVGAMVYGLTATLFGQITFRDGRVLQGNFNDYAMVRMDRMPDVDVHIVPSRTAPKGAGETSVPPIAPAVANAVFAATGVRVRTLPLKI